MRCLSKAHRLAQQFVWICGAIDGTRLNGFDWTGCVKNPKRTNGGIYVIGRVEIEFYTTPKDAYQILETMRLASDYGCGIRGSIEIDVSVDLSIAQKQDVATLKYIIAKQLWIHEKSKNEVMISHTAPVARNTAELNYTN